MRIPRKFKANGEEYTLCHVRYESAASSLDVLYYSTEGYCELYFGNQHGRLAAKGETPCECISEVADVED